MFDEPFRGRTHLAIWDDFSGSGKPNFVSIEAYLHINEIVFLCSEGKEFPGIDKCEGKEKNKIASNLNVQEH